MLKLPRECRANERFILLAQFDTSSIHHLPSRRQGAIKVMHFFGSHEKEEMFGWSARPNHAHCPDHSCRIECRMDGRFAMISHQQPTKNSSSGLEFLARLLPLKIVL